MSFEKKTYKKLRIFMFSNGITQKKLGEWLGVTANAINIKMKNEKFTHKDEKILMQEFKEISRDIPHDLFLDR